MINRSVNQHVDDILSAAKHYSRTIDDVLKEWRAAARDVGLSRRVIREVEQRVKRASK